MERPPLSPCPWCGQSCGDQPQEEGAGINDRKLTPQEKKLLKMHLRVRHSILAGMDELLSRLRYHLLSEVKGVGDGLIKAQGWLRDATAAFEADDGGDAARFNALQAAARILWSLEADGYPTRDDVIKVFQENAIHEPEDEDDA